MLPGGELDVVSPILKGNGPSLAPTKEIWKAAERLVSCFTGTVEGIPAATVFPLIEDQKIHERLLSNLSHKKGKAGIGVLSLMLQRATRKRRRDYNPDSPCGVPPPPTTGSGVGGSQSSSTAWFTSVRAPGPME